MWYDINRKIGLILLCSTHICLIIHTESCALSLQERCGWCAPLWGKTSPNRTFVPVIKAAVGSPLCVVTSLVICIYINAFFLRTYVAGLFVILRYRKHKQYGWNHFLLALHYTSEANCDICLHYYYYEKSVMLHS